MRVAVYYSNTDIRIEEAPKPVAGRGELVLRVHSSGICGSDVMQWYRVGKTPLVLGHEIGGEIHEVGEGLEGAYSVGDRVSASHHVPCNDCHYCRGGHPTVCDTLRSTNFDPGGFAEYLRLPAINVEKGVYRLPDGVSYDEATFIEPLACVYRAQKAAGVGPGRPGLSVLVIGSGISGLLHIRLARALGASAVVATDISDYRLRAAERSGAVAALRAGEDVPARVRELNDGRGADVVVLTAGAASAIAQAFGSVERGGTVLFFAPHAGEDEVPLPVNDLFWRNEITLTSSYAADPGEHLYALGLIEKGTVEVGDLVTHRLPLADIQEGFRLVSEAGESLKVVVLPQE